MGKRLSTTGSHKLTLLFLGVVVPPAVALVWLGLQLLGQDRSLLVQREMERRQSAAEVVTRSLEQSLAEVERMTATALPEGTVRFTMSSTGVTAQPTDRLLWLPVAVDLEEAETDRFIEWERREFQGGSGGALVAYQQMAQSAIPAVRAGALLRLARVHRHLGRRNDTLAAYRQLTRMDRIAIDGMPADLLARRMICLILAEEEKSEKFSQELKSLKTDFLAGRWMLDQSAWQLTAQQLEGWVGHPLPLPVYGKDFSAAADWLWSNQQLNGADLSPAPRRLLLWEDMTFIWQSGGGEVVVTAISPSVLDTWVDRALNGDAGSEHRVSLMTSSGQILAGLQPPPGGRVLNRLASESGLPWTLVLSPGDSSPLAKELVDRSRLLSLGLVAIVSLLAGASYLLWRVIRRELAVSRLQNEFVAAVSHEFRTPLASLRHVTELMQEDDNLPPERRRSFYESLGRSTERLHRLVESLLDFARMEGQRKPYDLKPLDAVELVTRIVVDFRKEAEPKGFDVDLDVEGTGPYPLLADVGSLSSALLNLLDNAVKYSPDGRMIRVSVGHHPRGLTIAVQDNGLGIPRREQKEIFRRFVRGETASQLGIQGTGLGLTMVSHIVSAHGGDIEMKSEEGVGSTFRMVLPSEGER